jgi:hypothetical protein
MKNKIEKTTATADHQNKNGVKTDKKDLVKYNTEGSSTTNPNDADLGNQMDDDILTFDEEALENPNPTKQKGEENERPGGGLQK